jgi:hypothetical protein
MGVGKLDGRAEFRRVFLGKPTESLFTFYALAGLVYWRQGRQRAGGRVITGTRHGHYTELKDTAEMSFTKHKAQPRVCMRGRARAGEIVCVCLQLMCSAQEDLEVRTLLPLLHRSGSCLLLLVPLALILQSMPRPL